MVKKSSKRGLNTGNTIRKRSSVIGSTAYDYIAVRREARFGCEDYKTHCNQLSQVIPSSDNDGVEYSLSKKQRWELIPYLRELAKPEEGNTEDKVNLYVHQRKHYNIQHNTDLETSDTVKEFQTNMGPVEVKTSQKTHGRMHMWTTDLAHLDIDHMSKRERQKLGREKFAEMREAEKEQTKSYLKDVTSTLNCHVVQRTPANSQMYQSEKAYDLDGNFQSKARQRHRAGKTVHADDYLDYLEDFEEHINEDEKSVSAPRTTTASLADYLDNQQQSHRISSFSTSSDESATCDSSVKGNVQFISRQSSRCDETTSAGGSTEAAISQFSPAPKSTKVELNKDDVSVGMLKAVFGDDYEESYCFPRVFNIKLSTNHYLVLQQNGYHSNVFRVHVTGNSQFDVTTILPVFSLLELVKAARATLTEAVENDRSCRNTSRVTTRNQTYINTMKNWQITTQQFDEFTQEILKEQIKQTEEKVINREIEDSFVMVSNQFQRSDGIILYCGVCFDELNPSETMEAGFIGLLPCNHVFCLDCWSTHVQSQLAQATVSIRCAEYDCNSDIDPVLVRSLVEYRLFQRHIERKAELLLQTDDTTIFCPNQRCNKVIGMKGTLINKEPITVFCVCGASACLVCQKDPHWPIPCNLVHKYTDALKKDDLYNSTADFGKSHSVVVNYKPCPLCKLPIEKDGGCVHMVCSKCRTSFCWTCLVPYTGTQYYHECPQNAVQGKQAELTSSTTSMGKHYSQAVRQRCRIGGGKDQGTVNPVRKKIRPFLSNVNMRQALKYAEDGGIETLTKKLKHIAVYCYGARRLLENCAALNFIRRGNCILCPQKLLLIELYMDIIDNLTEQKCSSKVIDSIFENYAKAKQTSDAVIAQFSNSLYRKH